MFLLNNVYKLRLSELILCLTLPVHVVLGNIVVLKNRTDQSFYFIFFHIGFTFCKENTAICRNMAFLGHNKDVTSDDQ